MVLMVGKRRHIQNWGMEDLRENKKNYRVFVRNSQGAAEHIRKETEEMPIEIPSVMLQVMWLEMKLSEEFKISSALGVTLYRVSQEGM